LIAIDQGAGRFRQFNLTRLILNPAYLLIIVCLWASGTRAVHWYVIGLLAANALVALVRVLIAAKEHSLLGPLAPVWGVVRQAFPFAAAGFVSPFLQSADKALVLYLVGTEELGIYTVALTVSSVVNSLATSAGAVSFGIAAQEHNSNAFPRVAKIFRVTAWIWLIAGGGLIVVIPVLLPIVYGSQFAPATWPAIILVPAAAFGGQASILEESLRAQGRAFIGLEARAAGMGVFLMLGWFLGRTSGLLGVTVAFVVAQLVVLTFMLWVATKHFRQKSIHALVPHISDLAELVVRVRHMLPLLLRGSPEN
jgi:O-antigen/teichoic acid export membrane protein